jgi:uncharacterized protein
MVEINKLIVILHRDIGYFFSGLILAYCISGLALNHIDDWNPDFIIQKEKIILPKSYLENEFTPEQIVKISSFVGENSYKVFDFPIHDQLKIYYDNATLHIDLSKKTGLYEKISRRPIFYSTNILHRNSVKGWKWISDIFALMLILINLTGLLILKGKLGLTGRGKWFIAAGFIPPAVAIILFSVT